MKKPLIGISCHNVSASETWFHGYNINYIGIDESHSIIEAGGIPLVLPQCDNESIIKDYIANIDGLLMVGGEDVSPSLYNEEMLEKCDNTNPERDLYDSMLIKEAFRVKKPIIVICRGLQLTNVLFGGSLFQDLSYNKEINIAHSRMNEGDNVVHSIDVVDKDSMFYKILKRDSMYVNSIHHQTIKELAPIFKKVAVSKDNVIEVVELKEEDHFFIGTQFHPEMMSYRIDKEMNKLFVALVKAASK